MLETELLSQLDDANKDDDFLYYLHRGSELLQRKKPDEARLALERAYQLSPNNPKAQNLLGLVYFKLGLLEAAKSIYDRMVEEYPTEPPLYVNLGLVLLRQGRLNEAERTLRKAIAIQPDHTRAHCYLGLVLYRRGDLEMARDHFMLGRAEEFARKVEQKMARREEARPSQAELLRAVAENGFSDLEQAPQPFKPLDYARDERVVRDEDAWEAMVTHGDDRDRGASLGMEVNSLLPVWTLTPLPRPADLSSPLRFELTPTIPPAAIPPDLGPEPPEPEAMPTPQLPSVSDLALEPRDPPRTVLPSFDDAPRSPSRKVPSAPIVATPIPVESAVVMPSEILFGRSRSGLDSEAASGTLDLSTSDLNPGNGPLGFTAGPSSRAKLVMSERAHLRASTIIAASGRISMTPTMAQLQGHSTGTPFGQSQDAMCLLEGNAVLILRVSTFAVALRGVRDLHVVESALMGFDRGFTWDNGKILGIDVVTLRGDGSLLLDVRGPPALIPIEPETPVHAARSALLAWSDGIRPSPVDGVNGAVQLFRLRGHGYVLVAFPADTAPNANQVG
jgi:Flp pilus assembly protein TadD